uniref:Predicted protein n=1 Tax=Hordeum vulgare subsp. vulgare TaxID=112509 RepID=F2DWV0_HORVV|nr:predicted protein [Hordeum vulgare subsp. vulgare]
METDLASWFAANLKTLAALRQQIHSHPELSFHESNTADVLINFFKNLQNPPKIVSGLGGTGFLAIFDFNTPENRSPKTVVFRSELDAVAVTEKNEFEHKSQNHGVAHKCGHDGHMAMVAGLGLMLSDFYKLSSGKVILLFQPAEETGEGAQKMMDSFDEDTLKLLKSPDTSIFALHNVPGFPEGSVVLPRGASFASASKGMHIKLKGACCHASQPHLGRSPALAMCNIIQGLLAIPSLHIPYDQKAIVTICGARAGEKAFGVSAGDAEVMATLRSTTNVGLDIVQRQAVSLVNGIASTYGLHASFGWEDPFAATINDMESVQLVQRIASECEFPIHWMDEAFPWSEDFGVFLLSMKGAMFGIGMGEAHEPLHGESYDFNDDMIQSGMTMFSNIMLQALTTTGHA